MNRINNSNGKKRDNRNEKKYAKNKKTEENKSTKKVTNSNINNVERNSKKNNENKPKKKKKKKTFLRFIFKILLLLFLIILVAGGFFYYQTVENGGGVKGALITFFGLSVEEVEDLETINVLVLGVSEDIDKILTDTIIVCSYNPQNNKASMISIPRDTFVGKNKDNAKGSDKINSLYSKSPEKLISKVSEITGIDLDYYAVVNTNALVQIVDIIGGVDFEVPINMNYDDETQDLHIHLKKGMQKIDGNKAEQLLRFRHNNDGSSYPSEYGDNDYGRMRTQREFIVQTLKQTIDIKNLLKSKTILNSIFDNIETNIDVDKIITYIPTVVDFDLNSIISRQLPGESQICNELWFYIYDKKETKNMVQELKTQVEDSN